MVTLTAGLRNSLIILEMLRNDEELKDLDINVGAFTNCREVGLTFAILSGLENGEYVGCKPFTWCIYEHRNSDEIIINGKEGYIYFNGELPYNGESKYDYLKAFNYKGHVEAAQWLAEAFKNWFAANKSINKKIAE